MSAPEAILRRVAILLALSVVATACHVVIYSWRTD